MKSQVFKSLDWDIFDNALASFPMLRHFDLVFRSETRMREFLEAHTIESKLPRLHSMLLGRGGESRCRSDNSDWFYTGSQYLHTI